MEKMGKSISSFIWCAAVPLSWHIFPG